MKAIGLQRQHGWAQFVSMQPHYNLIYREEEREMLPLCLSEGIGVTPWSPLARGLLAGRSVSDTASTKRAETDRTARALYEATMAQIAYAWVASRPAVTAPIVGISKLGQFEDAIAALDVTLSEEDVATMEAPYRPKPVAGHS